jgi:hypothetical protein
MTVALVIVGSIAAVYVVAALWSLHRDMQEP